MQTLGKVMGGLGLLLLLSSPVTLVLTAESSWYAGVKALLGLALIGVYVATNYKRLLNADAKVKAVPDDATNRPMSQGTRAGFFYTSTAVMAVVAIGAGVAANYIAAKRSKTWDLTNKKIYSLAPQTVTTLQELKQPVRAIGFLPPSHPYYEAVEQLFKRYRAESDKFEYEFKDPRKNPDLAAKYQLKEGQTTVVLTRGEGANASHTALNMVSEQDLTNALLKLNTVGEQKVYFLAGHGEWSAEAQAQGGPDEGSATSVSEFKRTLAQEGYAPESLNLAERQNQVPKDAAAVVVAGPKSPLIEAEKAALKRYLEQGGRLLYFADVNFDAGTSDLLAEYGVQVDPGVLADDKVNPVNPYIIVSPFFGDHEVTGVLKQLRMNVELPTARGLTVLREGTAQGVVATPLVLTSPFAWEETTPDDRPAPTDGEKTGSIPVVVASTRPTAASAEKRFDEARVVVFGDSELLVDALWGHEPNRNLVMNAMAWTTQQVNKITIRPPDRDISTIDIDNDLMARIRFIAMDMLPLSLIGMGLAIYLTRRNR